MTVDNNEMDYVFPSYQIHPEWNEEADEVLVQMAQSNAPQARDVADFLLERHKNLVRVKTRAYYLLGADRTDLVQEGMIGLYTAIMNYKQDKNTSFKTFAAVCVKRHIVDALRISQSKKHSFLNEYVSFEVPLQEDENKEVTLVDMFADPGPTPEEELVSRETAEWIQKELFKACSAFEAQVLRYYLQGFDYNSIAEKLAKTPRNIDNALQRIKKKCTEIMKKFQEE